VLTNSRFLSSPYKVFFQDQAGRRGNSFLEGTSLYQNKYEVDISGEVQQDFI
jgi:hypothetical protein